MKNYLFSTNRLVFFEGKEKPSASMVSTGGEKLDVGFDEEEKTTARGSYEKIEKLELAELRDFFESEEFLNELESIKSKADSSVESGLVKAYDESPVMQRVFELYKNASGLGKYYIERALDEVVNSADLVGLLFYTDKYSFNELGRPDVDGLRLRRNCEIVEEKCTDSIGDYPARMPEGYKSSDFLEISVSGERVLPDEVVPTMFIGGEKLIGKIRLSASSSTRHIYSVDFPGLFIENVDSGTVVTLPSGKKFSQDKFKVTLNFVYDEKKFDIIQY